MTTRMFTGGGSLLVIMFQNDFRSVRRNALAESWPREHHDVLFGEVKTGNTPVMAPTTRWYGIEPWLAPEDEKLRHDASSYHSAANVVVDSTCWRSAGRQRAQRAERGSDLAESRQWNFLQLLAELRVRVVVREAPQLALPAYLHYRIGSAHPPTLIKSLRGPERAPGTRI